jgi:hypothetical protein
MLGNATDTPAAGLTPAQLKDNKQEEIRSTFAVTALSSCHVLSPLRLIGSKER